ncbi:TPA: GIY-YIG nuclease family protein [Escherichia coli]
MKTSIINGSEVSRLSVAIHISRAYYITRAFQKVEPENCRIWWRPSRGGFSVRQAHFLKGKDAMNQLEEKLQRMISLYKEDNCQKVPENIAELMELASEFSGMLKSSGVRSAFFVEMLMHGGLMATMRRVMEDQRKEPPQVYVLSSKKTGLTKIGYSSNIPQRIKSLGNSGPDCLKLECLIPGGRETENMLHRKFAAKRKHGEWFALSKDDIEGLKSVAITSDGY